MKKILFLIFVFLFLLSPTQVFAHPADEIGIKVYDQKQTLEVSPVKTVLKIDLTFYAIDKAKLWSSINTDPDQELSNKEKDVWMKKGQEASWLEVDGKKYGFSATNLSIPDFNEFFSAKPVDVSIGFTSKLKIKPGTDITYVYTGKDYKLETIKFEVRGVDGLTIDNLRSMSSDRNIFTVQEGSGVKTQTSGINASNRLNKFLETYVKVNEISGSLALTAIMVSFFIGALHALTPGHGKAIIAGYLVGEKGTITNAIQLGLIITITHTASVFLLGVGTLFLTQYIVPSVVVSWLSLVSGILVAIFGLYLLIKRLKHLVSHTHAHSHSHSHSHSKNDQEIELSWKNLLPLGISGGLVPCIDALAILIVAASLGKIIFGLILLIVFSLGLAGTLIGAGIIVVFAKQKAIKKISAIENYEKYTSIISAVVVIILGIVTALT